MSFRMLDYNHILTENRKTRMSKQNQPSLIIYDLVNQIYYYKCLLIIGDWRALGYTFSHNMARALDFCTR
jgi:hypothetical protein